MTGKIPKTLRIIDSGRTSVQIPKWGTALCICRRRKLCT